MWLECARGSITVTPCAHSSHKGQVHMHSPPLMCHSASLKDLNWHVEGGYEKKVTINCVIVAEWRQLSTKKNNNQRPSVHIDQPALLEINRKIATMGAGGRFSSCQKIGLSLFGIVCLFFGGVWPFKKLGFPPKKYIMAGRLVLDPLHTSYSIEMD